MSKKEGLVTKEEIKAFQDFILGKLNVKKVIAIPLSWVLPGLIDGIDNKYGDLLPEPWQTHAENLFTMLYNAITDGKITDEEQNEILNYTAIVLNEKIDLPDIDEADELVTFQTLLMTSAALIRQAVRS